jgi:hypothetical protein
MSQHLLREAIRQILREAAGPDKISGLIREIDFFNQSCELKGLQVTLGVGLKDLGRAAKFFYALRDKDGNVHDVRDISWREFIGNNTDPSSTWTADDLHSEMPEPPYGSIEFGENWDGEPCLGAWTVSSTKDTLDGWGPLLYDLAIELSTQEAGGLTSDRGTVSPDARSVWGKYLSSRGDVEKEQMDNIRSPITPVIEDDCSQQPAEIESPDPDAWLKSPLSKAYRKPPVIMGQLDSRGLLWRV